MASKPFSKLVVVISRAEVRPKHYASGGETVPSGYLRHGAMTISMRYCSNGANRAYNSGSVCLRKSRIE
jgi:hypothetical protein